MSRPVAMLRLRPVPGEQLFVLGLLWEAGVEASPVGGGELLMPAAAVGTLSADHRAELNRALRDPLPVASDPQPTTITPGAAPPAGATGVGGPPPSRG